MKNARHPPARVAWAALRGMSCWNLKSFVAYFKPESSSISHRCKNSILR